MKKILFTLLLSLLNLAVFACHGTSLNLISGPTAIGGGQYSTVVQVCFAQYTTGNWGGTQNFNLTVTGTTFVSFLPATITNNYNAYTTAVCAGPNCFMGTCAAIAATATGAIAPATVVTYNTTGSVPAGFPIVPDDNESCVGCPTSFCFNFTFVTAGYPTSITLGGNIERLYPKVCRTICGFPLNYGPMCNGTPDPSMTITFGVLPIELLFFNGYNHDDYILLEWVSATESNNDYYTVERSVDGMNWISVCTVNGSGNSSMALRYTCLDESPLSGTNYYRLMQTDYNGQSEYFDIIAVTRDEKAAKVLIKIVDILGNEITDPSYEGIYIEIYQDGSYSKKCKLPKQ